MKQKIKPVHLNFIRLRHKLNISQAEYGDKLSISKNLVVAIESGRYQPRIEIIYESFKLEISLSKISMSSYLILLV
jgi:DNA-binding XRE family transcriptional regulator